MGQEREESQGFFEMLWDCDHCDARGLLARSQRYCANCGAPQNPDKRYFPQPGQEQRVDGHLYEGADRTCPACGSPNSARARNCVHCGSVLDGAAEVRGVSDAPAAPRTAPQKPRRRRRIWPYVLGVLAILVVGIWWRCIRTQEAAVVVTGHSWKRVVAVEQYKIPMEQAWDDQVPLIARASIVRCEDRKRSTRQVEDGEDCHVERRDKKDGTFEQVKKCTPKHRDEPVMGHWCSYPGAPRWMVVPEAEVKKSGSGMSPAWPTNLPPTTAPETLGSVRQGKQTETLTLEFGEHGTCPVDEPVWRKYGDGQKLTVQVHASGSIACDSVKW